jgi:hypothetical protein
MGFCPSDYGMQQRLTEDVLHLLRREIISNEVFMDLIWKKVATFDFDCHAIKISFFDGMARRQIAHVLTAFPLVTV